MFTVKTDYPIAYTSPDHINPHGTRNDNSKNPNFIRMANELIPNCKVLDIGCAGGGMIEDFVNNGNIAIGLEGSDYSKVRGRAAWATIPNNLFTCDVSKNFDIFYKEKKFKADIITMWEVLEHFTDETIDIVLENVSAHLEKGGFLIASICTSKEGNEPWHNCVHNKEWWDRQLNNHGFYYREDLKRLMDEKDAWVRSPYDHFACHEKAF